MQVVQLVLVALPGEHFISAHGDGQSADCQMGGPELKEVDFDEGDVQQVARVDEHAGLADINRAAVVLEERLRGAAIDIELDDFEDQALHASHLVRSKRVLSHLDEIGHDRRVNLLELGSDEHGGDAEELELVEGNFLLRQIPVYDVHCDEERFRQEAELDLDYDEPVDQYFPLVARYLPVIPQVVGPWHEN